MKKIVSIILAMLLCVGLCLAFTVCSDNSDDSENNKAASRREERENELHAETAKTYFSAVMESYNGFLTIKGSGMDVTSRTTIGDVINFLEAEGVTVTIKNLNTTLTFLSACEEMSSGYYVIKDNVDWLDYYAE